MMFNKTTEQVLAQLASGKFCSGQQLGELLGVSRAAIGKHINALQALGLNIYSVTGKGYKLAHGTELLNVDKIKALLADDNTPTFSVLPVVGSTNEVIKKKILSGELQGMQAGHTVFAEAQTAGRGRRGRQWVSPLGSSLYFSTHWRFEQGISATMGLSLAVGVAICEALGQLGVVGLGLKWPNDVYLDGKKLAGILIELESQGADSCDIVIGIGINVALPAGAGETIDQPFTDLAASGIALDRNIIAAKLLANLWQVLNDFDISGFKAMVERWNKYDCFVGEQVELLIGKNNIKGIAKGVDAQGGITLTIDGEEQTFFGGEISLRKAKDANRQDR